MFPVKLAGAFVFSKNLGMGVHVLRGSANVSRMLYGRDYYFTDSMSNIQVLIPQVMESKPVSSTFHSLRVSS